MILAKEARPQTNAENADEENALSCAALALGAKTRRCARFPLIPKSGVASRWTVMVIRAEFS